MLGQLKGIQKNKTRSGLYYDGYRILEKKRPAISIIENVKNLTSKRFREDFENILKDIENLGYNNYWKVLNAKDYGIPQNRERVFIISIRKDIDKNTFVFPPKVDLVWKLKDLLEENVENKYYLSDKGIGRLIRKNNKLIREKENPNISACIISSYYKLDGRNQQYILDDKPILQVNEGTKKGYAEATVGDSINISYPYNISKRGRVGKEISNTITTAPNMGTIVLLGNKVRIRKLTPLECWRLMGFNDIDFLKAKSIGTSDTQLYRQAR